VFYLLVILHELKPFRRDPKPEDIYFRITVMCMRFLSFLVVLFVLGVTGCMEQSNDITLPQPQSLVQEFSTFQPPAKPMETPDVPEIAEPTGVITLRQALALTLMHNPELKAFSWDVRGSYRQAFGQIPLLGLQLKNSVVQVRAAILMPRKQRYN